MRGKSRDAPWFSHTPKSSGGKLESHALWSESNSVMLGPHLDAEALEVGEGQAYENPRAGAR